MRFSCWSELVAGGVFLFFRKVFNVYEFKPTGNKGINFKCQHKVPVVIYSSPIITNVLAPLIVSSKFDFNVVSMS
jgi:hypothetical protein